MKTAKYSIMILATILLVSCKKGGLFCYKEDGNIVTEERTVSAFSEVALSSIGNVYVEQAAEQSVIVETSSNLQDIIQTKVHGNTLEIKTKHGKCIHGNPELNIYVKTPDLTALRISGSGTINGYNLVQTTNMDLDISGSGDIQLDSLDASDVNAKISGSGSITVASHVVIDHESVKISGSGSVNTLDMQAIDADVEISGSGNCKLYVLEHLYVNISGSGDVLYKGTPAITFNGSGSGTVRPY